jgi:CHASE3 domain sensor protein
LLRFRRPDRWYLASALCILLAVSLLSYQDWAAFQRSAPQVQHSREVLEQIEQVLAYVRDAESSQRGFLLTGNPEYLEPYKTAIRSLPGSLAALRAAVDSEPAQRTRVASLTNLISEKMGELERTVSLRQSDGFEAALAEVNTNRGERAMDDVRQIGQNL